MTKRVLLAGMLLCALGSALWAQEHEPTAQSPEPKAAVQKKLGPADILLPHLVDSKHLEYPCFRGWTDHRAPDGSFEAAWACHVTLPSWPIHVGSMTIDMGPTKHSVWLLISAVTVALVLVLTARAHRRHSH